MRKPQNEAEGTITLACRDAARSLAEAAAASSAKVPIESLRALRVEGVHQQPFHDQVDLVKRAIDFTGASIQAGAGAPELGKCPYCGGFVILRQRQRSRRPGDTTYFWRHEDNTNLDCPARVSAASRIVDSERS